MLKIEQVTVSVDGKPIVRDISLSAEPGTLAVCMGPNGSGKSTLINGLAGHPFYEITSGTVTINGTDITQLSPDKRARSGLFLSMQNPVVLPGVMVGTFLKESFRAVNPDVPIEAFQTRVDVALELLQLENGFLSRAVNDGFSGGEKKKCEMLQLLVLQPKVALLDEIDSGLDVDALKAVGAALNWFIQNSPKSSLFIITHYQNILDYIVPDQVLVMVNGKLVKTGDKALVNSIGRRGYEQFSQT